MKRYATPKGVFYFIKVNMGPRGCSSYFKTPVSFGGSYRGVLLSMFPSERCPGVPVFFENKGAIESVFQSKKESSKSHAFCPVSQIEQWLSISGPIYKYLNLFF